MSGHGSLVLGVETSCDDTGVALVDPQGNVIASCVASQAALHNELRRRLPRAGESGAHRQDPADRPGRAFGVGRPPP